MKLSGIATVLMSGTFLTTSANALDITADQLNNLTGPNISWSDSTGTAVQIGDQTFYYTYTAPSGYEETTTSVENASVVNKLYIDNYISNGEQHFVSLVNTGTEDIEVRSDFVNNTKEGSYALPVYVDPESDDATARVAYIGGNFINNVVTSTSALGGAIYNRGRGIIDQIEGNFINNSAISSSANVHGGAIDNHGTINSIKANFIGNRGVAANSSAQGGAVNSNGNDTNIIGLIYDSNFIGNVAESTTSWARGGALFIGEVGEILNSNFLYNEVIGNDDSLGGAIYSTRNLQITADNGTSLFEGNTVNGESNAIYMSGGSSGTNLNLTGTNKGVITFNDDIDGNNYNINILGGSD